jgi:hypothetical protein
VDGLPAGGVAADEDLVEGEQLVGGEPVDPAGVAVPAGHPVAVFAGLAVADCGGQPGDRGVQGGAVDLGEQVVGGVVDEPAAAVDRG